MPHLKIYKASAGSGKTHHLALEYLKLVLHEPENYRHILAVTFTNKATEEMKTRILQELYMLSTGGKSKMEKELLNSGKFSTGKDLQESAVKVLKNILYDYSNFSISTIDSFFQKILRNFIRETGLQAGYQPETDTDRLLDLAVDMLYMDIGRDEELTNWLIRFAGENIEDGKNWNLKRQIKSFSYEIPKENFYRFSMEIGEVMKDKSTLGKINQNLAEIVAVFENTMAGMGKEAIQLLEKHELTKMDFAHKGSSFVNYFYKIALKTEFEPLLRPSSAMDNLESWMTKTTPTEIAVKIRAIYNDGLNRILKESICYYRENSTGYYSAKTIRRYFNVLGILANLTTKLSEIREEENVLLISDAGILLKGIINNNDSPFIYEKTGNYYRHFLIDEFQDTSTLQWENFRPLLINSLAEDKDNTIVGDIKQSIYRWRGGDWNLLLSGIYHDFHSDQSETINLDHNWRSKPKITAFNNSFFLHSPILLKQYFLENCEEIVMEQDEEYIHALAEMIVKAYRDNYQQGSEEGNENEGLVRISFFEQKDEDEVKWKEQVNQSLPDLVDEILNNNYKQGDITILVRTAREGQEIAHVLLETGKYDIISKEAVYLGNSPAVRLIIAVLRYLHDPSDSISLVNILKEYNSGIPGKDADHILRIFTEKVSGKNLENFQGILPDEFTGRAEKLASMTIYDLVEELIILFRLNFHKNEWIFIQAFQDAVLNYSLKFKSSTGAFLEWWDTYATEMAIQVPDNTDAIRIMTIHKAKGLDFKILLIPYCNWNTDHQSLMDHVIWSPAAPGLIDPLKLIPLKYSKELSKTYFARDFFLEKLQAFIDNLNLLYVAMTRPVEGMFIMAPLPPGEKIQAVNSLLYHTITKFDPKITLEADKDPQHHYPVLSDFWDDNMQVFSYGKLAQRDKDEKKDMTDAYIPEGYISNSSRPEIRIKKAGIKRFSESDRTEKLDYGTFMHEILSKIKTKDESSNEINRLWIEGAITLEERNELSKNLEEIINVRPDWFSGNLEVKTETPVILGKGKQIIPDRVLIEGNKAVVIDFKFGESHPGYNSQVKNYMEVLGEMGYYPVEGYLFYADTKTIEKIDGK